MRVHVWHGANQKVGHLGEAQDDFNLVGQVVGADALAGLSYSLNGGPEIDLSVGDRPDGFGDARRLAATGDFNADIPIDSLNSGMNHVLLRATDNQGSVVEEHVGVERRSGRCTLPVSIDWSKVAHPQDVGQIVDGDWALNNGALRVMRTGYDRVFLIGEKDWQDYEVTVPVTIHHVDEAIGPVSGSKGVGLLLRFTGHVVGGPFRFPAGQPKWGWRPFGAITWLNWRPGEDGPPQTQFFSGGDEGTEYFGACPVQMEHTYWMKARCQTLADNAAGHGVTRYSFKVWPHSRGEPDAWDWHRVQVSEHALRHGGAVLLSHHVAASFGNVTICSL